MNAEEMIGKGRISNFKSKIKRRGFPLLESAFASLDNFRNVVAPILEHLFGIVSFAIAVLIAVYLEFADKEGDPQAVIARLSKISDWLVTFFILMIAYIIGQNLVSSWRRSKINELLRRIDQIEEENGILIDSQYVISELFKSIETTRAEFDAYLINISDRLKNTSILSHQEILSITKNNSENLPAQLFSHLEKVCVKAVAIINEAKGLSAPRSVAVNIKWFSGNANNPRYFPIVRAGASSEKRRQADIMNAKKKGVIHHVKKHYCYFTLLFDEAETRPYFVVRDRQNLVQELTKFQKSGFNKSQFQFPDNDHDQFYRSSIVVPIKGPSPEKRSSAPGVTPSTSLRMTDGLYKGLICVDYIEPDFFSDEHANNYEGNIMVQIASHIFNLLTAYEIVISLNKDVEEKTNGKRKAN